MNWSTLDRKAMLELRQRTSIVIVSSGIRHAVTSTAKSERAARNAVEDYAKDPQRMYRDWFDTFEPMTMGRKS